MEKPQYVYIILCTQPGSECTTDWAKMNNYKRRGLFYKIGQTNNLVRRLSNTQVSCPFELTLFFWTRFKDMDSAVAAESGMHSKYREHRIRGEWFFFVNYQCALEQERTTIHQVKKSLARFYNAIEISEQLNFNREKYIQCKNEKGRYFIHCLKRANVKAISNFKAPPKNIGRVPWNKGMNAEQQLKYRLRA